MEQLKAGLIYVALYGVGAAAALGSLWLGVFAISVPVADEWYDDLARSLLWFGPTLVRFLAGLVAIVLGIVAFSVFRPDPQPGRMTRR